MIHEDLLFFFSSLLNLFFLTHRPHVSRIKICSGPRQNSFLEIGAKRDKAVRRLSSGAGGGGHDRSHVPPTAPVARLRVGEGMDEGDRRTSRWSIFGKLLTLGREFARPIAKEACSRAPVGGSGGYRTQQGADVK